MKLHENTIIVKGGSYRDVKRALQAWINLSSDKLLKDICFEMYRNGRGNHVIRTDSRLSNIQFFYLVNYLTYPMNIEYKAQVRGYMQGEENRDWPAEKLMVYISDKDTEYANVFLVNEEHKNYKVPFALGEEVEEVLEGKNYHQPLIANLILPDVLSIQSEEIRELDKPSPIEVWIKRWDKGMLICTFFLAIIFLLGYLISDPEDLMLIASFGMLGITFLVLLGHEMLRYKEIFFRSFLFAGAVAGYAYLLFRWFHPKLSEIILLWGLYPLGCLLVQWPLRKVYLLIFKREPSLDKTGKLADVFYSMILYTSLIVLSILFAKIMH